MAEIARHCLISGQVQGVGFRYFACRMAEERHLGGFVRNLPGGEVEVWVQGAEDAVADMLLQLKTGPTWALVTHVETKEAVPSSQWIQFSILR